MITGIILAAGAAERMGQPKLLLPLDGRPMVWYVANAACQSRLDSVILVTGAGAEEVISAIAGLPISATHNPDWAEGQSTSLIAGLKSLAPETEAVMFLLADQPRITPALINALIDVYHNSDQSIICPFYEDLRGNPVLFGWKQWKKALTTLSGDQGAREIIRSHPESVHKVLVESAEMLWDVDTEEDYQRMCEHFQKD